MDTIGKMRAASDLLDPARAAALHSALDLAGPAPMAGNPLPPFWHYAYFGKLCRLRDWVVMGTRARVISYLILACRAACGRGEFTVPRPLAHWCVCNEKDQDCGCGPKNALTGALAIVTLQHEFVQLDRLCVTEDQSLIYRADAAPDAEKPVPPLRPWMKP